MFDSENPSAGWDDQVEPKIHFHTAHQGKHSLWYNIELGCLSRHGMVLPSHPQMFPIVWNCEASGGLWQRVKHVVFGGGRFCHDWPQHPSRKGQRNQNWLFSVCKTDLIVWRRQMYCSHSQRWQLVCCWCWINSKTQRKLQHRKGSWNRWDYTWMEMLSKLKQQSRHNVCSTKSSSQRAGTERKMHLLLNSMKWIWKRWSEIQLTQLYFLKSRSHASILQKIN